MLKKLFGRRKRAAVSAERTAEAVKHVYTADDGGKCPKCGGNLERRSCWLALGGMAGETVVDTDIGRLCEACPTMVIDTGDVAKLAKRNKMKGALPVGTATSATDTPVEFETFDGTPLDEMSSGDSNLMAMFAKMLGVDPAMMDPDAMAGMDGMAGMQAERRTVGGAEKQRKKSKRKQAAKARKKNRKR